MAESQGNRRAFLKAALATAAAGSFAETQAAQRGGDSLAERLETDRYTRFIDQNGKVYTPKNQSAIVTSGFYDCPACHEVMKTMTATRRTGDMESIVLVTRPEISYKNVEAYLNEFKDKPKGRNYEKLPTLLFTQTWNGSEWELDDNKAEEMESKLIRRFGVGGAHDTNARVFDSNGRQVGEPVQCFCPSTNVRNLNADEIRNNVDKALGRSK